MFYLCFKNNANAWLRTKSLAGYLYRYMQSHPDIQFAPRELHFFDQNYERGKTWYEAHFSRPAATAQHHHPRRQQQQFGEKTPWYCFDPRCMARVVADYPQMKLIVLLRDPVTRAYSQFNHMRQETRRRLHGAQAKAAAAAVRHRSMPEPHDSAANGTACAHQHVLLMPVCIVIQTVLSGWLVDHTR